MKNGIHIEWSPVNQAWFVMWYDTVLYICNTKADAQYEMWRLTTS